MSAEQIFGIVESLACGDSGRITLEIKLDKYKSKRQTVEIPIKIDSEFELMPYEKILKGESVRYCNRFWLEKETQNEYWELKILSGSLRGKTYKFQRCSCR